jgi:hypothetical protein
MTSAPRFMPEPDRIVYDLSTMWRLEFGEKPSEDILAMFRALGAAWIAELGRAPERFDPRELYDTQCYGLFDQLRPLAVEQRVAHLAFRALERSVVLLRNQSYALAKSVHEGACDHAEGKRLGEPLLARLRELQPRVNALPAETREELARDMSEALLDLNYAARGGFMSMRLGSEVGRNKG